MKKILEFKNFEILNNPENYNFLSKVKKENPDLYFKFVNILNRKGLEQAKIAYDQYDPEKIKQREKEEKINLRKKKKEDNKKELLNKFKYDIEKINNIRYVHNLVDFEIFIDSDINIRKAIKPCRRVYKSDITTKLKNINKDFIRQNRIKLGTLLYIYGRFTMISIDEVYNKYIDSNVEYFVTLDLPSVRHMVNGVPVETEFIKYRNHIVQNTIGGYYTKEDVFEVLKKFSHLLSDEFYEDWVISNNASKYNL
jgi:hypothetical protein